MRIQVEIAIAASARATWAVLGEGFGEISEWAAPIIASSVDGPLTAGTVRTCRIAAVGPVKAGIIKERLLAFDRQSMTFRYEAAGGLPSFVASAANTWAVQPAEGGCVVRTDATLELQGLMRVLSWPIRRQMTSSGARVLDELKHRVEQGAPHPRKLRATGV